MRRCDNEDVCSTQRCLPISLRYYTSIDHPRIHPSDEQFLNLRFGDVPVILVFTKLDNKSDGIKSDVFQRNLRIKTETCEKSRRWMTYPN